MTTPYVGSPQILRVYAPVPKMRVEVWRGKELRDTFELSGTPAMALSKVETFIRIRGTAMADWRGQFTLVCGQERQQVRIGED